jgi:hypothetical protein
MKRILIAALLLVGALGQASASPITQAGFSASATTVDLSTFGSGATVISASPLTATGGLNIPGAFSNPQLSYSDVSSVPTTITLTFSTNVSALGVGFVTNDVDPTLSLFDATNTLIDSLTLDHTLLPLLSIYPTGFIGLDMGANVIAKATVTTTLPSGSIYIGPVVFQSVSAAPEPLTLSMFGAGLAGVVAVRRRKSSKAA